MDQSRLKTEAVIKINGLPGKHAEINLQPLADLFNATSCMTGEEISEKIESVKDILVLSWDENANIEIRKLKDAYFLLTVLSDVISQFKPQPLVESGFATDADQLTG